MVTRVTYSPFCPPTFYVILLLSSLVILLYCDSEGRVLVFSVSVFHCCGLHIGLNAATFLLLLLFFFSFVDTTLLLLYTRAAYFHYVYNNYKNIIPSGLCFVLFCFIYHKKKDFYALFCCILKF